jgi:prepilin-type N-terminal cleavage/methylation domain-containing protein
MRRAHGFSLVEMAIALVVAGLLLGAFALPLWSQQERINRREADGALRDIRESLLGYAALHGRLPCPDSNDAPESPGHGFAAPDCPRGEEGFLPHKTLGLPAHDAWGRRFRYRVDPAFTRTIAFSTRPSPGNRLAVRALGEEGKVQNNRQEPPVALFFSLGANGKADAGNAQGDYRADLPTPEFDDHLGWIARPLLYAKLISSGHAPWLADSPAEEAPKPPEG